MQTDFTNENLGADRFDLWWVLLVTVLWLVVALVVLRFTERSTATVGLIVGVVLVGAGVNEFLIAGLQRAWRWFHVVMGLLLLAGGLWASSAPGHVLGARVRARLRPRVQGSSTSASPWPRSRSTTCGGSA